MDQRQPPQWFTVAHPWRTVEFGVKSLILQGRASRPAHRIATRPATRPATGGWRRFKRHPCRRRAGGRFRLHPVQQQAGGGESPPPSASSRTPGHFRPVVRDGPDLDHVRQRVAGVARLTTASARRPLNALSRPVRGCPEFPGHPLQRGTGCSRCTSSGEVANRDPTPSAPVPGIPGTPGFYGQVVKLLESEDFSHWQESRTTKVS